MDISEVQKAIKQHYDIDAYFIEKIKNVYKVFTEESQYCLKVIKYEFPHFIFILSAIRHLQNNGFKYTPSLIKSKNGSYYIKVGPFYAYLTKWITSRQSNYDNPVDVLIASSKLAELHKKSEGFEVTNIMKPRVGWFKWINTFETRRNEILDFKKRIEKKDKLLEFDVLYLSMMEEELDIAEASIHHLCESPYVDVMREEINRCGFCHHDYANHNVLIKPDGKVNIIDFDYCILDSHLHDLASLIIRCMKNGKWDINSTQFILDAYSSINLVKQEEISLMAAFIEFPQDYWQVGIQYYWEKQPWGEEFFLKKLKKIKEDIEEKNEFIETLRYFKYN